MATIYLQIASVILFLASGEGMPKFQSDDTFVCEGEDARIQWKIPSTTEPATRVLVISPHEVLVVSQELDGKQVIYDSRASVKWTKDNIGDQIDFRLNNASRPDDGEFKLAIKYNRGTTLHPTALHILIGCPDLALYQHPRLTYKTRTSGVKAIRYSLLDVTEPGHVTLWVNIPAADPPIQASVTSGQSYHTCTGTVGNHTECEAVLQFDKIEVQQVNVTLVFVAWTPSTQLIHVLRKYPPNLPPGTTTPVINKTTVPDHLTTQTHKLPMLENRRNSLLLYVAMPLMTLSSIIVLIVCFIRLRRIQHMTKYQNEKRERNGEENQLLGQPSINAKSRETNLTVTMELVQAYTGQITADTSLQERLTRTKALVADIRPHLSNGGHYDADTVAAIIEALLRVTLDRTHTDTEIRDYTISPEVCQVVQSLITGPVTASDVLRGMTEAVEEEGVGFDRLYTWSAVLANKWFVRPDHTVCPTSPGFVITLFEYHRLCGDRQQDVCGNRYANMDTVDDLLFPLVRAALPPETAESINRVNIYGSTALHYASTVCLLPQVTAAILSHQEIDVNVRNKEGRTALTYLVIYRPPAGGDPLAVAREILAHPGLDVSVLDNDNKTALDHCLDHLDGSPGNATRALKLLRLISQHPSCTSTMIQRALERLVDWEVPSGLQDLYTEVVTELAANTKYDINTKIKDGMTLAHIAASKRHGDILLKVMDIAGFNPNVQDNVGNTPLYTACANLNVSQALKVIGHPSVMWNFHHKNCVDQTVLDYYRRLPGSKRDPIVMGRLEQKVGIRR